MWVNMSINQIRTLLPLAAVAAVSLAAMLIVTQRNLPVVGSLLENVYRVR